MMLYFCGCRLDLDRAELHRPDAGVVKLRPKTFEILRLLVQNAGRVLRKQELMEAVWPDVHVGDDNLFQCIREIRAALGDDTRQTVKLVSGRGYLFTAEVTVAADAPALRPAAPAPAEPTLPEVAPTTGGTPEPAADRPSGRAQTPPAKTRLRRPAAVAAGVAVGAVVALAAATQVIPQVIRPDLVVRRAPPTLAVTAIVDASGDPRGAGVAADVTARLTDGFAHIDTIRVVAPRVAESASRAEPAALSRASSDYELRGELQRAGRSWVLRARLIRPATGEIQAVATVSVDAHMPDPQLQQSRLAAGVGHPLARRLNESLEAGSQSAAASAGRTKVVIEQATAAINQTSRERFGMAQTMLEGALAAEPDNVDLAVALAALQMRGIQMVWYTPDEAAAAEAQAGAALERALAAKPNAIAVLETQCRFLSATNRFVESLVSCARAASLDPWNGLALYLIGLGQLHLGRFEDALATFRQADQFDTPAVSRWTWRLGAGWAQLMLGRGDDAVPWIEQSIAITPGTGRSHMLLAAALQQAGRTDEARAAMQEGLRLRPGTTAKTVAPPTRNASPLFVEGATRLITLMVAAGLPEQ
ncbi:winged helix-turn-helix domain-containing protein [Rhodoplanes azumiensis]|uniref:Winged helix-turn-helix domain-containing protein n=1 Tax=Rhodoplanes azumiensis TaxID=1897628 RepID=A0ABW5AFY0_9BRAD